MAEGDEPILVLQPALQHVNGHIATVVGALRDVPVDAVVAAVKVERPAFGDDHAAVRGNVRVNPDGIDAVVG